MRSLRRLAASPFAVQPDRLRAGAILDEFSWDCLAPELQLVELHPRTWRRQLRTDDLDLVLVESAWAGNRGRWRYALAHPQSEPAERLRALLATARAAGIPTVFWNKEDPPNFEQFAPAAMEFDVVATTAAECVPRYHELRSSLTVDVVPFAAQPALHHPAPVADARFDRVCFAGSWRAAKYPERALAFHTVLAPPLARGVLDIYDRNAAGGSGEPFPDPYADAVIGSLSYADTVTAYRRYGAFVNVNSIDTSPTMMSRRVFEILACGTPVISTPSRAISAMLGEHVITVHSAAETEAAIDELLGDPDARMRRGHRGYRFVHRHHTYRHRVDTIRQLLGIPIQRVDDTVSIAAVVRDAESARRIAHQADLQTLRPRRLVLVAASDRVETEEILRSLAGRPDTTVIAVAPDWAEAPALEHARPHWSTTSHVAFWQPQHLYGPEFLGDLMLPFSFSKATVVGKSEAHRLDGRLELTNVPGHRFRQGADLMAGTLLARVDSIGNLCRRGALEVVDVLGRHRGSGNRTHAADQYNFVQFGAPLVADAPNDRRLAERVLV